jgi:hypothetical protein
LAITSRIEPARNIYTKITTALQSSFLKRVEKEAV